MIFKINKRFSNSRNLSFLSSLFKSSNKPSTAVSNNDVKISLSPNERRIIANDVELKTSSLLKSILLPLNELTRGPLEQHLDKRIPAPTVLLLGNHSSGKSSYINYLLGQRVQDTGVAPTDDSFTIITTKINGKEVDRDGPSLVGDVDFGFSQLIKFGPSLVNQLRLKVRGHKAEREEIKDIIFIDSPGMIDSPKFSKEEVNERGYNFESVVRWFAEKSDVILLFFDPDKPGTTGETLKVLTNSLAGLDYKLYLVFNKVDQFEKIHDFARAYGSLCWNLSKVIPRKDMPRIFTVFTSNASTNTKTELVKYNWVLDDLEQMKQDLFKTVLSASQKRTDNLITQLYNNTKLLNLHATMLEQIRLLYSSEQRKLYWQSAALPATLVFFDIIMGIAASDFVHNYFQALASMNAMGFLASAGIAFKSYRDYQAFLNNLNDEYLEKLFQALFADELFLSSNQINEELKSLWQLEKPRLFSALKVLSLANIPKISSNQFHQLNHIIEEEIPKLRKMTSHLQIIDPTPPKPIDPNSQEK